MEKQLVKQWKFIFVIVLVFLSSNLRAQEDDLISPKEQKKLAKEEQKAQKAREQEQIKSVIKYILEQKRFVLEADYLADGKGNRIPVSSNLNFIAVDSTEGVIQIGTLSGAGWNGVGGITTEGKITKYDLKVSQGKKSTSYNLMLVIMTSLGIFDVSFYISESGSADATVRSTTRGQLRYSGNIVPVNQSRVYKGTSIY